MIVFVYLENVMCLESRSVGKNDEFNCFFFIYDYTLIWDMNIYESHWLS